MPVKWIDVTNLSFNSLLLLERIQLSWFPGWLPEEELAIALQANPVVEWYLRHKCPDITSWLDQVRFAHPSLPVQSAARIREAEQRVLSTINDLLTYAIDPSLYDAQPFLKWDDNELRQMTDFTNRVVIDVGSGSGKLAFIAAEKALAVYAVEPVENLRYYLKQKACTHQLNNIFPIDGLITDLPFPSGFADITMGGHVFGDLPEAECAEMKRVTKPGGMIILCPGTSLSETRAHDFLISNGFHWSIFEEPQDGPRRKYWKVVE